MRYRHRFRVRASLAAVAAFHAQTASMAAITPPPLIIRVNAAPAVLRGGDRMDFTLWLGPLPLRWVARIEGASDSGFTDRQMQGPFREWVHRHTFRPVTGDLTEVSDDVKVVLRKHVLWGPVGLAMWAGIPVLFAYRGWKTRRILAGNGQS